MIRHNSGISSVSGSDITDLLMEGTLIGNHCAARIFLGIGCVYPGTLVADFRGQGGRLISEQKSGSWEIREFGY